MGPWPWPAKVATLYPAQETAIEEIVAHSSIGTYFAEGYGAHNCYLLDA